jgi:hypothetical protein
VASRRRAKKLSAFRQRSFVGESWRLLGALVSDNKIAILLWLFDASWSVVASKTGPGQKIAMDGLLTRRGGA